MNDHRLIQSAIKQLSPLWRIRAIETSKGTPGEEIAEIELRIISICKRNSVQLCQNLDITGDNANWAESYFAGVVAGLIADSWTSSPEDAESFAYAEHLSSLATEPMYAGLPSSWTGTDAEVSYAATTLSSVSRVMQAYAKFNLFHFDRQAIQNFFIEQIITTAQQATMRVKPLLAGNTDINSGSSLYQTFLRQAGLALADLWQAESLKSITNYQSASQEQKKSLQVPYDLKQMAESLRNSMESLADAVSVSLNAAHNCSLTTVPSMN